MGYEYYPFDKSRQTIDDREDRQLLDIDWLNPYTNTVQTDYVWINNDFVVDCFKEVAKELFNIDLIANTYDEIISLLDKLHLDVRDLINIDEVYDLCEEKFKASGDYEKAQAEFLDDYESLNDLGSYEEEDEYVE